MELLTLQTSSSLLRSPHYSTLQQVVQTEMENPQIHFNKAFSENVSKMIISVNSISACTKYVRNVYSLWIEYEKNLSKY